MLLWLFRRINAGYDQFFLCCLRQGDRKLKLKFTKKKKKREKERKKRNCIQVMQHKMADTMLFNDGKKRGGQTNSDRDKTTRHDDRQESRPIRRGQGGRCRQVLPMRSSRSMATVSNARRIMGYSSSTSLKWSTEREKRRQYVSARTLAVRLPLVSRQISV